MHAGVGRGWNALRVHSGSNASRSLRGRRGKQHPSHKNSTAETFCTARSIFSQGEGAVRRTPSMSPICQECLRYDDLILDSETSLSRSSNRLRKMFFNLPPCHEMPHIVSYPTRDVLFHVVYQACSERRLDRCLNLLKFPL